MISFKIVPSSDFSYALLLHARVGLVHQLHHLLPHSRADTSGGETGILIKFPSDFKCFYAVYIK